MRIGARDAHAAGFEWLAQRIEDRALKFGKLIEKQYAEMSEAHFTRLHLQSASG